MYKYARRNGVKNLVYGNAEDRYYLRKADIENAKLIIVATNNDTTNFSG